MKRLILVLVLLVASIGWIAYKKYTQYKNEREAATWEKFEPSRSETAPQPVPQPQPASSGTDSH